MIINFRVQVLYSFKKKINQNTVFNVKKHLDWMILKYWIRNSCSKGLLSVSQELTLYNSTYIPHLIKNTSRFFYNTEFTKSNVLYNVFSSTQNVQSLFLASQIIKFIQYNSTISMQPCFSFLCVYNFWSVVVHLTVTASCLLLKDIYRITILHV